MPQRELKKVKNLYIDLSSEGSLGTGSLPLKTFKGYYES